MSLICGLDTETTGFDPAEHRFVEVCARVYDLDTRKLKLSYVQRVNPQRPIPAAAYNVHGISNVDVVGEPTWDAVAPKLHAILAKCEYVIAHNGRDFDMPFVSSEFKRVGLVMPEIKLIDTMQEGRWATPNGKSPNLGELCFATDVEYDTKKAHGAEYDVSVMVDAFFKGVDLGFYKLPE